MDVPPVLRLTRAHFLIPGIMLYVLGALLAAARGWDLEASKLIFGYAIFGTAHLSVSFSNDYFDRIADRMDERTPVSGGSGVLQKHPELERPALLVAVMLIVISVILGTAFTLVYGYQWWFLLFVVAGNLVGWFYTAPPVRLAYRGWGELSTAVAAGLLMPGMGYLVATGSIDLWFLIMTIPLLCYGLFFIISVELPDVETDRRSGKLNMMVLKGRDFGLKLGAVATLLGTLVLVMMAFMGILEEIPLWAFALLSIIPLAAGLSGLRNLGRGAEPAVRQVQLNFTSLVVYVMSVDVVMILWIWPIS
jgi:1,4-dihydroxy-2-naphthoate octaprenyltransferase